MKYIDKQYLLFLNSSLKRHNGFWSSPFSPCFDLIGKLFYPINPLLSTFGAMRQFNMNIIYFPYSGMGF